MSHRDFIKGILFAMITAFSVYSVALAVKMYRLGRDVGELRSDIAAVGARERIPEEGPVSELGFALQWCNGEMMGYSSVERDPCRLECRDYDADLTLETRSLSEGVCESLP